MLIRAPRPLTDILAELFTLRGYRRLWTREELEDAWNKAVGEPYCRQTSLGEVRRGVLNVTVAHSTLLEELASFRKAILLKVLHSCVPAATISDIHFRVGAIAIEDTFPPVMALSLAQEAVSTQSNQPALVAAHSVRDRE